jgi:transcriptional regulator GlxA family with amidase domain
MLAQELLKSGNFKNINDVAFELCYSKPGYFSAIYKKKFRRSPNEDFISSTEE